jgi:hypothetical protein
MAKPSVDYIPGGGFVLKRLNLQGFPNDNSKHCLANGLALVARRYSAPNDHRKIGLGTGVAASRPRALDLQKVRRICQ